MPGERELVRLSRSHLDEAAKALALAFHEDPLINFILQREGPEFDRTLWEFFRFTCQIRLDLEWPALAVADGGRIVGAALVSLPEDPTWPPSLQRAQERFRKAISPDADDRLERYSEISGRHRPKEPHHYLGAIGGRPDTQGTGAGGALLNAVSQIASGDSASTGVGLDTENPRNVGLYEHFGYQIIARDKIDGIDIWCMFRPKAGG